MAAEDGPRWDARHADRPVAEPAPPDALRAAGMVDVLAPSGRALDAACGAGGQSVWLGRRGFDVVAVDVSAAAIRLTREAADRAGVAERIDARVVDLDAGLPADLDGFDVIVCQRFRDVELYDAFVTRLVVGGVAVVTVLSTTGAGSPGPFHAPPGELLRAFTRPDAEILSHHEGDGQESVIVRRLT
jgi:SAM-dependent methyltransferase